MKKNRDAAQGSPGRYSVFIPLFSLYPILFLYKQNIGEVAFGDVLPAMALAAACTAVLWFSSRFIFESKEKRALAVLAVLLVIYYYKLLYDVLGESFGRFLGEPLARRLSGFLIVALLAFLLFRIGRSKHPFHNTSKIFAVTILMLLAWNVGGILVYHVRNVKINNARVLLGRDELREPRLMAAKPDIYCFFVDEFASLATIADVFHYDNSGFAERLQAAGFFIARQSRGLYAWTPEAIAAVLNMEKVPAQTDPGVLIRQNRVTRFLKGQGYRIYDFPYEGLTSLADSEKHFFYRQERASILFNDFYRTLVEMSVFYPWVEKWQQDEDKYSLFFRKRVLYVFDQMPAVVKMAGPKFVLVHLFSPHAPFVFDRDGGVVAPEHGTDYSDRKYYLEQYLYISGRLAETLEMILKESSRPPIIIALSDHGYRGSFRKPFLHVVSEAEKRKIFLSLYLPGLPGERLEPALSPLNVFRVIFNRYFGQNLPELHSPER
jgi:hypothetical protein